MMKDALYPSTSSRMLLGLRPLETSGGGQREIVNDLLNVSC